MALAQQYTGGNLIVVGPGGSISFAGQIQTVELPEIESEMTERMDLSGHLTRQLQRRINALEATITTSGYYSECMELGADHLTTKTFQLFSNISRIPSQGVPLDLQSITEMTGRVASLTMGERTADDEVNFEIMIALDSIKETFDGQEIFNITETQWVVGGTDLIAQRNANIGV